MEKPKALVEWVGAIHLHTKYSDGLGTVDAVVKAARRLGLDFCVVTDHDDMSALPREGYAGDTLLLVGTEVTCKDNGHCLALGIRRPIPTGLAPQDAIDAITQQGGLSILAHPWDRGSPRFGTYYPWRDWTVSGYSALEVWNFLNNWGEGVTNLGQAAIGFAFLSLRLTGPNPAGLAHWDRLNEERFALGEPPVPVIGGVDGHGYFMYRRSLGTVRTHIWAPPKRRDPARDRHAILRALRTGRCFLANDALADSRGFVFQVRGRDRQYPRDAADVAGPADIVVRLPRRAEVRILRDGETVYRNVTDHVTYRTERPGTYRCEATRSYWGRSRPWIFTNAVHVR
ncbi:MAG: CehA/McbA family metallohydrolase [Firmicutes bacterium]|nr:CehA/McbA family metallohydrolase [Bacillota bacterium]